MAKYRIPKKGSRWYLPENHYRTAVAFCRQYGELKMRLAELDGMKGMTYDGMPGSPNPGDPTAKIGAERAAISAKIEIIESSVREADPMLYKWLLRGVTEKDMTYARLRDLEGMPCGEKYYFDKRKKVYWLVSHRI